MESETTARRRFYYGWVIVAVAFVTMSLVSPIGTMFQLFYQALKEQFQWSHASISGIYGMHMLLNGAMSPLVGWLLDRFGPRRMMPAGAVILGLGLALSSQITALWQLYLTFGVIAAGGVAMLQSVPNTAVISNWFVKNRGTAIGVALSGTGLGQLLLTPATQWLILNYGWRAAYLALAPLVCLVPAVLIRLFQHQHPADKGLALDGATEGESPKGRREVIVINQQWAATDWTLGRAVRSARFWALAVMTLVFSGGFFLISSQLFVLTQEMSAFQANSLIVALIIGAGGFQKGAAKFVGGLISDRWGREKTMTLSGGLIILGILALNLLAASPSAWLLLAATVLYGLGYGFGMLAMMAAYADLFQGARFGTILGTLTLGGLIGASVGTSLGGYLRDLTGGYQLNFLIAAVAFALAVMMMWSARPSSIRIVRRVTAARDREGQTAVRHQAARIN
jgi:MFS family permease